MSANTIDVTLYLVGEDEDAAQENLPFDSEESAESFAADNEGTRVFAVDAVIDLNSIRPA